jgi:hypothetical protein
MSEGIRDFVVRMAMQFHGHPDSRRMALDAAFGFP